MIVSDLRLVEVLPMVKTATRLKPRRALPILRELVPTSLPSAMPPRPGKFLKASTPAAWTRCTRPATDKAATRATLIRPTDRVVNKCKAITTPRTVLSSVGELTVGQQLTNPIEIPSSGAPCPDPLLLGLNPCTMISWSFSNYSRSKVGLEEK